MTVPPRNPHPGRFIAFEGIDGSGHSTQAALCRDLLRSRGRDVVLTREPTRESAASRRIAGILAEREQIAPDALQRLFAEDRGEHLRTVVVPALKRGAWVVSDRYMFSSFAFGSVDCSLEDLAAMNRAYLWPDLTLVLQVSPRTALARIASRGSAVELFENENKLRAVAERYDALARDLPGVVVIDGEPPVADVHAAVVRALGEMLQ